MKHKENSYLGILYQYESIIIISMSNISNKYINEAQIKYLKRMERWHAAKK